MLALYLLKYNCNFYSIMIWSNLFSCQQVKLFKMNLFGEIVVLLQF